MRKWLQQRIGLSPKQADAEAAMLRIYVQQRAGISPLAHGEEHEEDLLAELRYLMENTIETARAMKKHRSKRVLYAGQAYYNSWYLSRALRKRDWKADLLNWDLNEASQIYYHGEDVRFTYPQGAPYDVLHDVRFYVAALYHYDLFHFSNFHGICFGFPLQSWFEKHFGLHSEIDLLKSLGKKIIYSHNGCSDGVSQTSFSQWGPESVCAICRWRDFPEVCSDTRNLEWGAFRNRVADYQCILGGNRADYNLAPTVHESPEFYCLEPSVWDPTLAIPEALRLPEASQDRLYLYHAVGNKKERTDEQGVNIKSSHIYVPLIEKLQAEGHALQLLSPENVPNLDIRFLQMQADIFLDMLTFGWFGANAREAMMLGKPVICFIRPEWLESCRREMPDYAAELPVISATPHTVEAVLRDLIASPEKRRAVGKKSREFALKWHSAEAGATRFDRIYRRLLKDDPLLTSPGKR